VEFLPVIDTHLHLFDPQTHPFAKDAAYQPQPHECASWGFLHELLANHGMQRAVLVAPTVGYNYDLRPLTNTLRSAARQLVGVARLHGNEKIEDLEVLANAGVQGVRLDLRQDGSDHVAWLMQQGAPRNWQQQGWFVQVQADATIWSQVAFLLAEWPVTLVIDHCGLPDPAAGLDQVGFRAVCELARRPSTLLKLSGAFRFSKLAWPYPDCDVFAQRLFALFGPEHCIWGSDWPFVRIQARLDYGVVLAHLNRWVPDAAARQIILEDTPARLLHGKFS
jgi:predicted TIM-barrel fold metal-dependent hydrolase